MKTHSFTDSSCLNQILNLGLILALGLVSCSTIFAQDKSLSAKRTTIVFIDKTASVTPDSYVQEKNTSWLKKIVKGNAVKSGDKIIVSFIFENTASLTNKNEFIYHPPVPSTRRMSSSEARLDKVKFDKRLRAYKKGFAERIITKAFSQEANLSGTDIVGSIHLLSKFISSNPSQSIKAFYLSDMVEASLFQNLHGDNGGCKLESFAHAHKLAKEDIGRILTKYELSNNCLKSISEITVVFPALEMNTNKSYALLPEYWSPIFKSFGVQKINYF